MKFQDQTFQNRHSQSEKIAYDIMDYLFEKKKIAGFKKTNVEVDKAGIDYLVDFGGGDYKPVQFKLRENKYKDIPVCRFQPFRGFTNSTIGRDYKSLYQNKNNYYFVGLKNEYQKVYILNMIPTQDIVNLIDEAEKEWFGTEEKWIEFTEQKYKNMIDKNTFSKKLKVASNGIEAWFKKNRFENFGKINYYIPMQRCVNIIAINF